MERIAMSQEEEDRLDWLKRARDQKMTQREVADKMGVSDRGPFRGRPVSGTGASNPDNHKRSE